MSRGAGRIELAIEAAFGERTDDIWPMDELAVRAYPGINHVQKKHRVAVARAARKVCERIEWVWGWRTDNRIGGTNIYYQPLSARSHALASGYVCRGWRTLDELRTQIDDPSSEAFRDWQEGGIAWMVVEMNKAVRSGDSYKADKYRVMLWGK